MSAIAAIILAAGQGTRFGREPKLLAELGGKPLVRHVADAALASRASPVIAVLGHCGGEVARALPVAVLPIENPGYAQGLATSLKAGFAALPAETEAAVILLGDMPAVSAGLIDFLIAAWVAGRRPAAAVLTFRGQRGNPTLLSRTLACEIARLSGDTGAGPLLRERLDVLEVPVEDPAVVSDIDTPAALAALGG